MKQYLELLQDILDNGEIKDDRTGVGTYSVFGRHLRFDLRRGFPAVTTKKLAWKSCVGELLWFIEGSSDERRLAEITHGDSEGKIVNALIYKRFICLVNELENGIDAFIAHLFGGLALSLAMQDVPDAANKKMVLIAPATETTSALQGFYKMLQVKPDLQKAIETYIISMAGKPISYFSVTHALTVIDTPCLWIHDKNDRICPFSDTLQAQTSAKPHQEFFITEGLGHNKVYRDQGVMKKIGTYLDPLS